MNLEETVRLLLEERFSHNTGCTGDSMPGSGAENVVLAAVSGGVDSMVMLTLLKKAADVLRFSLAAVTVNHNIRAEEETAGDAALVEEYCRALDVPVRCVTLARNQVAELSVQRGNGTEEAARVLRYQAFEEASRQFSADVICLAHNRNDRLETLLQRFFQGASVSSQAGMSQSRGIFFRPLFDVTRKQIEEYAALHGVPYRTDSTNADNSYLRNRIRNVLMPQLNTLIPGWETAVLHGAEKTTLAAECLKEAASRIHWTAAPAAPAAPAADSAGRKPAAPAAQGADRAPAPADGAPDSCISVAADEAAFFAQPEAVRLESLYEALDFLGTERRVPYSMLLDAARGKGKVEGAGIIIERRRGSIVMEKVMTLQGVCEDSGFYSLIRKPGRFSMPWGDIIIRPCKEQVCENAFYAENIENGALSGEFRLPVIIRSRQPSDVIKDADGGHKEVSKLFSEWHIPKNCYGSVPLFAEGEICGVWGGVFGYPDYFVKTVEDMDESE